MSKFSRSSQLSSSQKDLGIAFPNLNLALIALVTLVSTATSAVGQTRTLPAKSAVRNAVLRATTTTIANHSTLKIRRQPVSLISTAASTATSLPSSTVTPGKEADAVLLDTYYYWESAGRFYQKAVKDMTYRPRSYAAAPYVGWDTLTLPNGFVRTMARKDWLHLTAKRAARVVIVWDGPQIPNWLLSSWTRVANHNGRPTFQKNYAAGKIVLGGIAKTNGDSSNYPYTVLIAEAGGVPSKAPAYPAGQTAPQPNQTCPAWVHDRYVTTNSNGTVYPTWHRQVDPTYYCYFHHEHGSNPELFKAGYKVPFGYVADIHEMVEPHSGFKQFIFDRKGTDGKIYKVLAGIHFGTANPARSCNRFHSVDFHVLDKTSGEVVAKLQFMGDFGGPVRNTTDEIIHCPNLPSNIYDITFGIKKPRVVINGEGNLGYENWRLGIENNKLGIVSSGSLTFDTTNPMTGHSSFDCHFAADGSVTCGTPQPGGDKGEIRLLSMSVEPGMTLVAAGASSGTFYTNPHGTAYLNAGDMHAVEQYLKPGLNLTLIPEGYDYLGQQMQCFSEDAFNFSYKCDGDFLPGPIMDIDGQLRSPN